MIELEPRQNRLPSSQEYAGGARRRAAGLGVLALLLSIAFALGLVTLGAADAPVLFVLLTIIATFVCVLRFRGAALYVTLVSVCLFELYPSGYSDAITDRLMFFSNINTLFQDYAHAQVKAIPFSLFELIIVTAAVASFVRAVLTNTLRVRGGSLVIPIAIYIGFVLLGWLVGLASGGDFKISLQEVRSQVYFFLAYLMAVNVVRDRGQITTVLWVMAICIGIKGILYTFRRYVTLAGVMIPDQGVGSHEEAFLFDAFVVLALVLFLCGIYKRLQFLLWSLMPMVVLGNLATNRRAATAAVVVIVPSLIAAAFQGLPKRRKLAAGLGLFLAIAGPLYYQAFKNSASALGQPARAIKSQFQPDERDALSNAYRDAEAQDLYATIKSSPILGYGYGRKMIHAVPIADISKNYEWWDIMTHNQILWVWMRVGTLGFFAFWMMIAAIIFKACEAIKAQDADLEVKAVGLFTLVVIGMLLIFGLLDLQLSNFRDMLFAGMWVGFLAATPYFKPLPKQEEDETKTPPPLSRRELYAKPRGEAPPPRPNAPVGGISIAPLPSSRQRAETVRAEAQPPPSAAPEGGQSRVARNVIATLATQLISWALAFAVTLFLPRYLGDANLGSLTLAASLVAIVAAFVPLGTSTVLIKEIARDHSRAGELLAAALLLRLPLGLIGMGLTIGAAYLFHYEAAIIPLIVFSAIGMIVAVLNDALASTLQGLEHFTRLSAAIVSEKFLASALTIAIVIARGPLWAIAAVGLFTGLVQMAIYFIAFRPLHLALRWPTGATLRHIALAGVPYLGMGVFFTLYGQTDPLVIKSVSNRENVGWYSAALRLLGTTMFLPVAISSAVMPTLTRLYQDNGPEFNQLARRTLSLISLCAIPIAAVLLFLPDRLITLMHYPAQFAHSIPVLRVGGLSILLWYATTYIARLAISCDREQGILRAGLIATLVGIPACFSGAWLTYHFWGNAAIGALSSDTVMEVFLLNAYLKMLPSGTFGRENLLLLGRCAAASLPMLLLLAWTSHLGLGLWVILPVSLVYFVMCWVCGCLRPNDVALLRSAFARKAAA